MWSFFQPHGRIRQAITTFKICTECSDILMFSVCHSLEEEEIVHGAILVSPVFVLMMISRCC